ncbi:MAG: ribosome recycling factor [Candidatus Dormibacteria bacterium]
MAGEHEDTLLSMEGIISQAKERMERSIEALKKELVGIRTGRANPALVDRLQIDYYGSATPLQSLANISTPEARLLVIQPFDRTAIPAIEKAIMTSELGLTPSNDGQVIRVGIPQLTEERRQEYVKLVHKRAEEARVSVRNIRRDTVDQFRKLEKAGSISKDEVERELQHVQKVTDSHIEIIEGLAKKKEAELLEV